MKTFITARPMVPNPEFRRQKETALHGLSSADIDAPLRRIIAALNRNPVCFTLQSCYGHFLFKGRMDPHNLHPLPENGVFDWVEYRIAYVACCVDNSPRGKAMLDLLEAAAAENPSFIQFGSADWFWERQINSYVLQVEPFRYRYEDRAIVAFNEALELERVRNAWFRDLENRFYRSGD